MLARFALAALALALSPALLGAGNSTPKPPDTVVVTLRHESFEVWPYTGTDFSGSPSDPVNVFLERSDPRAVRDALLALDGDRPPLAPFPLPIDTCTWMDGMGYEQTDWAETQGWVGSEVQLVCTHPGAPLGDPFRVHLRLFRQGRNTIGAAHFEILIPDTAEHEVLSWDFAREFVAADMARVRPGLSPETIPLVAPGYFRSVRKPIYDELVKDPGLAALLGFLGISADETDDEGNPSLPTTGDAVALWPGLHRQAKRDDTHASTTVQYAVLAPRPFCSTGPYDVVWLEGPVHFDLQVSVDRRGEYERHYEVDGELTVTPIDPLTRLPAGPPAPALVRERHTAQLDDRSGQIFEEASQELLTDPVESLSWFLAAGDEDEYQIELQCAP